MNCPNFKWPLAVSHFSLFDKLKFAKYILTSDRWTQSNIVEKLEKTAASTFETKYAVFVSSGSTANTILAMYLKDNFPISQNRIIFPTTTWITSVSPFLREGYSATFVDINLNDFSIDIDKLEESILLNPNNIACIFVTSLIGFTPNIKSLLDISKKYDIPIMMDNCENTLGFFNNKSIHSYFTSTTSTYFGHQIQSVEGGFIFTNSDKEYEYFLMARNHGMVRSLDKETQSKYRNYKVDPRFDFRLLGNNFRNTNLHAFLGLMDIKRAPLYLGKRKALYSIFKAYMDDYLILPKENASLSHAPFCLPIIMKPEFKDSITAIEDLCSHLSIETRPIISGNLLKQTCLYDKNHSQYKNSEYIDNYGFYIGLHKDVTQYQIKNFCQKAIGRIHD